MVLLLHHNRITHHIHHQFVVINLVLALPILTFTFYLFVPLVLRLQHVRQHRRFLDLHYQCCGLIVSCFSYLTPVGFKNIDLDYEVVVFLNQMCLKHCLLRCGFLVGSVDLELVNSLCSARIFRSCLVKTLDCVQFKASLVAKVHLRRLLSLSFFYVCIPLLLGELRKVPLLK